MQAQCLGMMELTELPSAPPDHLVPFPSWLTIEGSCVTRPADLLVL